MRKEQDLIKELASHLGISTDGASQPLTETESQALYATAYALYEQSDYANAAQLFTQLALHDPFCESYWRGLASAKQMTREYHAALHAWALTALLEEKDPLPHFHAAECYLSLDDRKEGLKALNVAAKLLDPSTSDKHLEEKISILKRAYDTDN